MLPDKLAQKEERYRELEQLLGDPSVIADKARYQKLAKEFSSLSPLMDAFRAWQELHRQIDDLTKLLGEKNDAEFEEMARAELADLTARQAELKNRLAELVNPKEQDVDRDLIIEIRAGTGGQEASLFAADLYRMYCKYAEGKGWKVEAINHHESDTGGFKEVTFSISGPGAARRLKLESGTHRVQRVPVTEASGRIHTSAATVAVMFEPEEIDVQIDPKDLKIDVFRSSGPGGQSVNTTDSAIRITHLPTGMVVICQDERSQLKNKMKAMRVLRARLHEKMVRDAQEKAMKDRKAQIGSGDRSEKIRTYNYPDHRVTDHRIGLTVHKLHNVMDGDLDDIVEGLLQAEDKVREETA